MLWSILGCFVHVSIGKRWKIAGGLCQVPCFLAVAFGSFVVLFEDFEHV